MSLTNNLLAFYNLDNTNDSSGNNNTLTNMSNVSFAAGKIGNAAVFNGSNHLRKSDLSITDLNEITFSLWVKSTNSAGGAKNFFHTGSGGGNTSGHGYYLDPSNGLYALPFNNSNLDYRTTFALDTWIHVTTSLTRNGATTTAKHYVNGNLVATKSTSSGTKWFGQNGIFVGRSNEGQNFTGLVDAVGVWNRELTEQEIVSLYNNAQGGEVIQGAWTPVNPYYIDGVLTTLNSNGTGVWNNQLYINGEINNSYTGWLAEINKYFIVSEETTLDENGTGTWNNQLYVNGVVDNSYNGWLADISTYFIVGQPTTLDQNGTGAWNEQYYVNETLTTLNLGGFGTWNDVFYANGSPDPNFTGFDSVDWVYYIDSQATTLDQNGDGEADGLYYFSGWLATGFDWNNWSGYYIEGVLTSLNADGFGTLNDVFYAYGSPDPNFTGFDWWDWVYYIDSQATTLDYDGSGFWDGKAYYYSSEQPTGYNNYYYYINNVETYLDYDGNGEWNGNNYVNGVMIAPLKNGWIDGVYYINDLVTTLDSSGNGTWNGITFINGISLNGLQAFYKLSDLTDSSGNSNTLTNTGSVSFSSGKIGNAAVFDGGNSQNLTTPVNGGGYTNGTSVSFWMRKTGNKGTCGLIQAVTGDRQGWTIINENNSGWFLLAGNGSWNLQTSPFLSSSDNNWHHIVITDDNADMKIYLDGSIATSNSTVSYTVAPVKLGTFEHFFGNNPQSFDGQIDAVGIWNRALSDSEIAALYNSENGLELPAPTGPTIKNGWITDTYWINDVATSLDQNGDGKWQGKLYEGGTLFSGTKYSLTFVDGLAQPENIVTVIGTNIPVAFGLNETEEPLVELVFASITSAGETTVEQIVPTVLPVGYTVAETVLAYSIDTTATFEGTINVDFTLPSNISQAVFDRVKGFHVKDDGTIEEMTKVSSDFSTKRITVAITSFSDFLFLDTPSNGNVYVKIEGKTKFYGKVKFA